MKIVVDTLAQCAYLLINETGNNKQPGDEMSDFTPELIGYIKKIVADRGISKDEMTKELMREIIITAQSRMNKMIDGVLDGADYGSERYRVAMQYTAGRIYFS